MAHKKNRAGVIPYVIMNDEIHMMFMLPSDPAYGGSSFQIAKGVIEDEEDTLQGALREGYEELGLLASNILRVDLLPITLHTTTFYVSQVIDTIDFDIPHFETGAVKWMTLEQFEDEGREIHRPIVKEAISFIKTII